MFAKDQRLAPSEPKIHRTKSETPTTKTQLVTWPHLQAVPVEPNHEEGLGLAVMSSRHVDSCWKDCHLHVIARGDGHVFLQFTQGLFCRTDPRKKTLPSP